MPTHATELIEAIANLNSLILTTNYDTLIERVTELPAAHWKEPTRVRRLVREGRGVIHLHGIWNVPGSVILGIRDYEDVKDDAHAKAVMQALE